MLSVSDRRVNMVCKLAFSISPINSSELCRLFAIVCYYYCVIKMELHKKDNPRVVGAEPVRWFVAA
jgi:hypothetical protein